MALKRSPALLAVMLLSACGAAGTAALGAHPGGLPAASSSAARDRQPQLHNWLQFGLNAQRSDASEQSTGIDAANIHHLRRIHVSLPGTVDSAPIYIHAATVRGASHDVAIVTTTYGKTIAIDANSGALLWTYTPPGYRTWAGSAQITTATPLSEVHSGTGHIYAAAPNGLIHKLSLANGSEVRSSSWPVSVTRDPQHEKIASALNATGPYLLVTTGGYYGDTPPYQGHVVLIERSSGHIHAVFNTLCANRAGIIAPASCSGSDSAIWSRAGAVVEPGGNRLLIDTGNGPWNGTSDFGDSSIELSLPNLKLTQAFTPANQESLNHEDTDLGSGGPAILNAHEALIGGKDGRLRLLNLNRMDGHSPGAGRELLGGEVQQLATPGSDQLITEPCVWQHGTRTTVFIADNSATAAYVLSGARLHKLWENSTPGTSPVFAGGLLYVYNPSQGGIAIYSPTSRHPLAQLPGTAGHWNSPIVVDGHVIEPEGNANDHSLSGSIDIFAVR